MVQEANRIWRQADIRIQLSGIAERSLNMPAAANGIGAGDLHGLTSRLNIRGGTIAGLVHRLRGNVHAGLAVLGGRICALKWSCTGGENPRLQGNVLAHEVGHLLGLPDYQPGTLAPGDIQGQLAARNNLMTSSVAQGTRLTQAQIDQVRRSPWVH